MAKLGATLAVIATGLLLSGCPRPGLPPGQEVVPECDPGAVEACYSGPEATEGVGTCEAGERECAASGTWGACAGEVLPQAESCVAPEAAVVDLDCDGVAPVACGEPVLFKTLSNPGIDAGTSLALGAGGRVLWGGGQSLTTGDFDPFVIALEADGSEAWRYEAPKGAGYQQVFQVVESGPSVFAAGTGALEGASDTDGYALRLSPAGLFERLSVVGSTADDTMAVLAPAGGVDGGVFAAGTVGGTAAVPEGAGASFGSADDLFVMRIQQDGFVPWNMVCLGAAQASIPRTLVHDEARSRLYLGLTVRASITVPIDGGLELKPANGDPSDGAVYVIDPALSASAPVTELLTFRSAGADTVDAIAAAGDGTFFVAGSYRGAELKLNGAALLSGDPDGKEEAFVARVNPAGVVSWVQRFGGPGAQRAHALVRAGGALYLAGTLEAPGVLAGTPVAHAAGVDLVVAKLDAETGEVVSLQVSEGKGDEWVAALAVDGKGGVWLTGDFSGELSFAGQKALAIGDFDAFLFRLPP